MELTKEEVNTIVRQLTFGQLCILSMWQMFFHKRHKYFVEEYRLGKTVRSAFESTVDHFKRKKHGTKI